MLGIPKRSRSSKKLARHTPSFLIPNSARNMTRTVPWLAEAHTLPRDPAEAIVARDTHTTKAECPPAPGPPPPRRPQVQPGDGGTLHTTPRPSTTPTGS